MSGVLLEVGLTKLALSLGLGLAVLVVQRVLDRPAVAHSLWAVVLAALLLPAVVRVPVGIVTLGIGGSAAVGVAAGAGGTAGVVEGAAGGGIDGPGFSAAGVFALVWLAGTAVLLFWSLARTLRFRRLLRTASSPASPRIARIAVRVAAALGLRRVPALHTTGANLTPMVWWIGGEVHLLIPEGLAATMDDGTLEWVIAHELAHIFRRDHVVRWPEWLACVVFWWNPVAWLTRRELRAAEEFCCDELVLASMGGSARAYGGSLVAVIDYLS